jgi:glycosyltransferase involved in cell wall biosynthesis
MQLSILMTVYNGETFLHQSIDSVLNSSFKNFEFVIVNDASTDQSNIILEYYREVDSRIKTITNHMNMGISISKNYGLTICKGRLIAMMDADDICSIYRFEKQVKFLNDNPFIDIAGTSCYLFEKDVSIQSLKLAETENLEKRLMYENIFNHPTVIFRREILDNGLFNYNTKFRYTEDYKLWTDLAYKINFGNIQEPLLFYRFGVQSSTSNSSKAPIRRELELVIIRLQYILKLHKLKKLSISDIRKFFASILKSSLPCILRASLQILRFKTCRVT